MMGESSDPEAPPEGTIFAIVPSELNMASYPGLAAAVKVTAEEHGTRHTTLFC